MTTRDAVVLNGIEGHPGDPISILRAELAGRYEIGGEVGRGGMAVVYRATDVRHGRPVALKILHPELSVALGAERFLREIQIEAQLTHPHIFALIESGQKGHLLYYITPWADGGTLRDRLTREVQLSLDDTLQLAREIGGALAHAHARGIVHRDVKPENILYSAGHAMLADFGIARSIADTGAGALTETGLAVGSPLYMSPEQGSASTLDGRSDQYGLACVLFEALVGQPPFTGHTARAIITRHMVESPPSIEVVRPDLPRHVCWAINKALGKVPAARFGTIEQFLAALATPSHQDGVAPVRRLRRWLIAASAVAIAVSGSLWVAFLARTPLSLNKVAVFPFATRALSPGDSSVGAGVAYLVEAALERANPLQLIDVAGSLTPEQLANADAINVAMTKRIARRLGAAFALRGIVLGHPDSTTVTLQLYSVRGDSLVRQASVSGLSTTPLHHLGIDALKTLLPLLIDPTRNIDLTPLRDRRARAIALWMQGERHYRLSQFDSASQFYERSVEDDSAMAMAAVKGAQAASWIHKRTRAIALVNHALSVDSLLPRRYSMLALGLRAYLTDSADSAVLLLRSAQALDPEWAEPAAALGEVYTHLLPREAPLDSLARASLSLALARDSGFTSPLYHLAEDAIRNERSAEANALIHRFSTAGADASLLNQLTTMRDCVGRRTGMNWTVRTPSEAHAVFEAAKSLSAGARQLSCADGAFRAILRSPFSTDAQRWASVLGLQGLLVARGSAREAKGMLDSVVASGRGVVRTAFVLDALGGAPFDADAESLDSLARSVFGEHYERLKNPEPLWVLLAWNSARGRADRVRLLADTIASRARETKNPRFVMYAQAASAHVALARGDTAAAIDRLGALGGPGPDGDLTWQFGDALPVERMLLARLLLASRRYDESIRAASVFDHPTPVMFLPFVGQSLTVRYEAALATGNSRAADLFRARLTRLGRNDLVNAVDRQRR